MKTTAIFILLLMLPGTRLTAAAESPPAEADWDQLLNSKIAEVTVYADRARVVREAAVTLPAGTTRLAFANLPGWIDEGSVRVAAHPPDAGQVLDVQIHRTYLARASDEEFRKAEAAVQEISDQIGALDDEKGVIEAQIKQVEAIRAFSLEKLPKDAAVREVKPVEYGETVKFVAAAMREALAARRELEKKRRDLQPELNARQRKLQELRQRSQLEQHTVVVTLKGGGKPANLSLTYMLPGATWEPMHELRADNAARTVSLASFAIVSQTTGEDWTGVKLVLSTQRSTETMKIPEVAGLLLGAGRKLPRLTAAADTFQAAKTGYLAQNRIWFDVNNPDAAAQREYGRNWDAQASNIKRIEQIFELLHQRGTTAQFPAGSAQTVRTDGRPVRVPIGDLTLAAAHRISAAPEVSLNAARIVDLTNTVKQPILPGKVALFLEGAFLGLTENEYVAPNESFSLYLGVADQVKLTRILDKKHSELKRSGQKTRMQVAFLVTVENLSDQTLALQLADRVPVSEVEEIKVSGIKITPDAKPDSKGLLKWDMVLAAKSAKEFRLEYTLDYPAALLTPQPDAARQRASPSFAPSSRLHEQILDLEKKF